MKRYAVLLTLLFTGYWLLITAHCLHAEDLVFLSLTRKAESLKDMPTSVSIVTPDQIRDKQPSTVADILQDQVGLTSGQYGTLGANENLMFRGSSSEQVLFMLDGRRINDPAVGLVNVNAIPAEMIDRIEIIRGGASAIYGTNAFGAAVNIITKKPVNAVPAPELSFSGGSFNTQGYNLNFGVKDEKASGLITAGKLLSDGWRKNSDYDSSNFFARFGYDAGTFGVFDLSGSFFRSNTGVPGLGVSLDQYDGTLETQASSPDARQKENKSFSRLENVKAFGKESLKTVIYASREERTYAVPSWLQDSTYNSLTFGNELQLATRHGTTFGTEWWQELYKQTDNTASRVQTEKSRTSTAFYVQQQIKYKKFGLLPSLRYDDNSLFGGVASPRLTVTFQANTSLKLSANSGKAWRAPTFNEFFWPTDTSLFGGITYVTKGNPSLVPEEGITSDIGAEYAMKNARTKLTFFLTESKNLIQWVSSFDRLTNTSTFMTQNIGSARQEGLEFEVSHKLASGLYHRLFYTYVWAMDTENHTLLAYRPCNKIDYDISYTTLWDMKATLSGQYVSSQKTGDARVPAVDELPEYALLGARLSQSFNNYELWIKGENLTDKQYQTRLRYPLPGRIVSAGLTMKFR